MQITHGIRSILSNSSVYKFFQALMRDKNLQAEIEATLLNAAKRPRILDIGCGTAEILKSLNDVYYEGFDISQTYIETARETFGGKANCHFQHREFRAEATQIKEFDIVLIKGVLHHLDDDEICILFREITKVLHPNGKMLATDPVYVKNQNAIANFLIKNDRGQNVRTAFSYRNLVEKYFDIDISKVVHQKFPPYDRHLVLAKKK